MILAAGLKNYDGLRTGNGPEVDLVVDLVVKLGEGLIANRPANLVTNYIYGHI